MKRLTNLLTFNRNGSLAELSSDDDPADAPASLPDHSPLDDLSDLADLAYVAPTPGPARLAPASESAPAILERRVSAAQTRALMALAQEVSELKTSHRTLFMHVQQIEATVQTLRDTAMQPRSTVPTPVNPVPKRPDVLESATVYLKRIADSEGSSSHKAVTKLLRDSPKFARFRALSEGRHENLTSDRQVLYWLVQPHKIARTGEVKTKYRAIVDGDLT